MSIQTASPLAIAAPSRFTFGFISSIGVLLFNSAAFASSPIVVYVDRAAPLGGNGSSWEHAYTDLQDAFDQLSGIWGQVAPSQSTIKIAQGVYTPDRGTKDRLAYFSIPWLVGETKIEILGGFAGTAGSDPDRRDFQNSPTILSGDLNADDGPEFSNRSDNSLRILTLGAVYYETSFVRIEGIEFSGASETADDSKYGPTNGAVQVFVGPQYSFTHNSPNVEFSHCTFQNNVTTSSFGAALRVSGDGVFVQDCRFAHNHAATSAGGAIAWFTNYYALLPISIERCVFEGNQSRMGGACFFSGAMAITTTVFANNRAALGGGAIFGDSQIEITHSLLLANEAGSTGGAIESIGISNVSLFRTTIAENQASSASAVHLPYGSLQARDTIFWRNRAAGTNPAIDLWPGINPMVFSSGFTGVLIDGGESSIRSPEGFAWLGDPLLESDPGFIRERAPSDSPADWESWNYRLRFGSPGGGSGSIENWDQPYTDLDGRLSGWTRFSPADLGCYYLNTSDCSANLNRDSGQLVDDTDFSEFAKAYNLAISPPANPQADFNRDGMVDDADFSIFVVAYDALLCP